MSRITSFVLFVVIGMLLRFTVSLEPVAWTVWLVPTMLLAAVLTSEGHVWRLQTLLAGAIGYQANAAYYFTVMSVAGGSAVIVGQALLWLFVLSESRRVVLRWRQAWTVVAYPIFWVAVDSLLAAYFPDGNWASLAYSQADFLPLMQTASLLGVPGVLFLLCLPPSAIAVALRLGWRTRACQIMVAASFATVALAIAFGSLRLREAHTGTAIPVGLAAIDDAIGLQAKPPYIQAIQAAYDEQITALAAEGARIVLLPEKMAVTSEADAVTWKSRLAGTAAQHDVWLLGGVAVKTPVGIRNEAWLFTPDGALDATYQKQFMAPPERADYVPGDRYVVRDVEGARIGMAICKDMHFATLGRAYGERDAGLMLVPAWDFVVDGWMGARMTAVRGIENGYGIVRNAREGRLTVTDAYGRIVTERESRAMPGQRLNSVAVSGRIPTLYTRIGNSAGWLCVMAAAVLARSSRRSSRPSALP